MIVIQNSLKPARQLVYSLTHVKNTLMQYFRRFQVVLFTKNPKNAK